IWQKGIQPSNNTTIASQLDIAPSVLEMLNIDLPAKPFIGESLFKHNRRESAIMTGFSAVISRDKDAMCFPNFETLRRIYYDFKKDKDKLDIGTICFKTIDDILIKQDLRTEIVENTTYPVYETLVELNDILALKNQWMPKDIAIKEAALLISERKHTAETGQPVRNTPL
ncbi:MAG: hypothetical protein OXE99_02835, partial [Cellvibrionales bacterium]|nr:hypothetical protein [Cellvibrionales bacterium]